MIIDRYIARQVAIGASMSVAVFIALFLFIDLVGELRHVGTQDYDISKAIAFVVLSLPQRMYELAPSAILLGGLISLGSMASGSELVSLRAAGVSINRLLIAICKIGVVLAILVAALGEFVAPVATAEAKMIKTKALQRQMVTGPQGGVWIRDGVSYIHIDSILPGDRFTGIRIYSLDQGRQLESVITAASAVIEGDGWKLKDVQRTSFAGGAVTLDPVAEMVWRTGVESSMFSVLKTEPIDMTAIKLSRFSSYLKDNDLESASYELAFWTKVFTPVICILMLVLAAPIVLSGTPRSGGTGQRILLGLLLGVAFYVFSRAINHLGLVAGVAPLISALVPILVVSGAGFLLLRRIS